MNEKIRKYEKAIKNLEILKYKEIYRILVEEYSPKINKVLNELNVNLDVIDPIAIYVHEYHDGVFYTGEWTEIILTDNKLNEIQTISVWDVDEEACSSELVAKLRALNIYPVSVDIIKKIKEIK